MSKDATEIKAAVQLMDHAKDTLWEPNGFPRVEVVRQILGDDTVTHDDIDEAIGAYNRKTALKPKDAAAKVTVAAPEAQAEPKSEADLNREALEKARVALEDIHAQIEAQEKIAETAKDEAARLTRAADKHVIIIERLSPQVSHADMVKRIQAQTQDRLQKQKEAAAAMAHTMAATGAQVFPSRLDAAMAMRKRSPEQNANYAKFVHQQAEARSAGVA